jgi:hypothetical protein
VEVVAPTVFFPNKSNFSLNPYDLYEFLIAYNNFYYSDVSNKIDKLNFRIKDSKKVIAILYSYSLLTFKNQNDDLFSNYREQELRDEFESYKIVLTKCLYHYYKPL